jgi:hypothetical protein
MEAKGWTLFDGQQVARIEPDPAHLVFTVDESMVGDRIEVFGQVHYHRSDGHRATWYPNVETVLMILNNPGLRQLVVKLLRGRR